MLKKMITYVDYDGKERIEEFLFNLNEAEVIEWLTTSGDYTLDKVVDKLTKTRNNKELMNTFKDIIYRAYGEKSLDGRRFIKSKEVKDNFMETPAYSVLFMELISDADKAVEFMREILPKDLNKTVEKIMSNSSEIPSDYAVVGTITPMNV